MVNFFSSALFSKNKLAFMALSIASKFLSIVGFNFLDATFKSSISFADGVEPNLGNFSRLKPNTFEIPLDSLSLRLVGIDAILTL